MKFLSYQVNHLQNSSPIKSTVSGILKSIKLLHNLKASFPILFTVEGMINVFNEMHCLKAQFPMTDKDEFLPILTAERLLHLSNA